MNNLVYLVINNHKSKTFLSFEDKWKIFTDKEKTIAYAESIGFKSLFGVSSAIGMLSVYQCGDIDVSIIPVEVV